ncbi:MAG: hypothetical protein LBL54_04535 [Clostridiales Family XIII bacterium]|jgi:hypothetical protein|nr:hypothetical protein [Clostridiales Family XIII bacterium]
MQRDCCKYRDRYRNLRIGIIAVAFAVMLLGAFVPVAFAADGGASLTLTSPKEGSTDLQAQNVGIKLYFDGDVTGESVQKANAECFKFTYESGKDTKELPVKAYSDNKGDKGYILAIVDTSKLKNSMLANDTAYKLIISGALASVDGRTLGVDRELDFRTVDQSGSTTIYMLLMVAMVAAMIGMTIFQNKRKEKAAAEVAAKAGKVNPYKLAKDKKISVKEAMELIERDRKRRLKRLGIAEGKDEHAASAAAEKPRDTRKVKKPRPISAAGSTYKTGRSSLVEKRAAEAQKKYEQSKAKAAKNNQKSGKNAKGGQKSGQKSSSQKNRFKKKKKK